MSLQITVLNRVNLKKKKYATIHCNETAEDQRQGKDLKNKEKIQRNYNLTDSRLLNSDRS